MGACAYRAANKRQRGRTAGKEATNRLLYLLLYLVTPVKRAAGSRALSHIASAPWRVPLYFSCGCCCYCCCSRMTTIVLPAAARQAGRPQRSEKGNREDEKKIKHTMVIWMFGSYPAASEEINGRPEKSAL